MTTMKLLESLISFYKDWMIVAKGRRRIRIRMFLIIFKICDLWSYDMICEIFLSEFLGASCGENPNQNNLYWLKEVIYK